MIILSYFAAGIKTLSYYRDYIAAENQLKTLYAPARYGAGWFGTVRDGTDMIISANETRNAKEPQKNRGGSL